ncbi:membrane protein insertase YidC [Nitrospira moscoviensis]|uniref:Membrane protein insertase YidC n=1 Tax=Nitrospira moscoviensis TaxID=42253 RepID=A0A0K2G780_NITMO|nr:membrane protein insertase YidC [Nitrospira moscoviensis]ALA56724.1 Inner-membrane protein insertion factor OxaA [Nitrospira moscoviensis]
MEKRVIVFLVLSLAIIFGYEFVLKELGLAPLPAVTTTESPASPPATEAPPSAVQSKTDAAPSQAAVERAEDQAAQTPAPPPAGKPEAVEVFEVETNLYRATFTTRGAVLTGWELKQYRGASDGQQPVQLVRQGTKFPAPLTVSTDGPAAQELREGLYAVEKDFAALDAAHPTGHVTFRYDGGATGVRLEKRLTFHADSYLVDVALTQRGIDGSMTVVLGTNFGIVEWGDGFIGLIGSASLVDGKVEKDTPEQEAERKGHIEWAGLQDKYFLSVLIPKQTGTVHVRKEGDKLVSTSVRLPAPPSEGRVDLQLYAGPKEYDTLRSLQIGLEDTIDFGWFIFGSWGVVKAVAKPIFYVLRFLNEFTHNYGLTIILLTIGIKMLFVPLQYKSYKSMKQMQMIQPKVVAVQEKFKDDRDRLNKELIKLYRDHKVNPVGGCLPMVLQMPVFVALFNILYMTIDLRQAPFMLWIQDLSAQDPYYVLPIIMGVTMVIQQKITPTTMDPTQAKIMLMLPAFMTFLFINFPAGLVLYWLTNNTLTIMQQVVTDRFIFRNKPAAPEQADSSGKK